MKERQFLCKREQYNAWIKTIRFYVMKHSEGLEGTMDNDGSTPEFIRLGLSGGTPRMVLKIYILQNRKPQILVYRHGHAGS